MAVTKYSIKNTSDSSLTFQGVAIASGATHEPVDQIAWASDPYLVAEILQGNVQVVIGSSYLSGESGFKVISTALGTNITTTPSSPPFGAKTQIINGVVKKFYARNTGIQQALTAGSNTITYTLTYPWVKIIGLEVINSEALDFVDLKVKDTAAGTYSGVPNYVLNQFAYAHNIPKDYYIRLAQFDADLYAGMVIEVAYTSVSAKTVGINLIMNEVKS